MQTSVCVTEAKAQETGGQAPRLDPQFVLRPLLSAVPGMRMLPLDLIARMPINGTLYEAARHSGKDDCDIAADMQISTGYMSKFMRGVFEQWAMRFIDYMRSTGSLVPLQKIAHEMGCALVSLNEGDERESRYF